MTARIKRLGAWVTGDTQADRVVPPTGFTARLTVFTAAVMAFLAVFAMTLSLASARLADTWRDALAGTATLRLQAPLEERDMQIARALEILAQTPGVSQSRALGAEEQRALLAPWFGPDLPLETLALPQLIEVTGTGYDVDGLRLRLQAELPGAVLDDHGRWRAPLVRAAARLQVLGWVSLILIFAAMGSMITLAANAALAANAQVISVLRLVGATDGYIARAFVRRFTLRALGGAAIGAALGGVAVALLPANSDGEAVLTGFGLVGAEWALLLVLPGVAGIVAFAATYVASQRVLEGLT